ncbi:hypothetical protein [Aminipila luticellarii]|uniref:Uncharacterized protein n=1 Tax=Aminipila luticellarii TaxID=2507160 RepID=A0A410PX15_9FIRM|nr:hypothetical protein [Aminipila luticellarii]QAT43481.1 hypothetical protein EQM06_09785 [Aminipila luticellarii]
MRKIKLIPDAPFYTNCDISIVDVTDDPEKKRCKIKVEYAESDVEQMKKRGCSSKEEVLEGYKDLIYDVVKFYIADDWECVGGYGSVLEIIGEKIKQYF